MDTLCFEVADELNSLADIQNVLGSVNCEEITEERRERLAEEYRQLHRSITRAHQKLIETSENISKPFSNLMIPRFQKVRG